MVYFTFSVQILHLHWTTIGYPHIELMTKRYFTSPFFTRGLAWLACLMLSSLAVRGQHATSGVGDYQGEIFWLRWQTQGTHLTNGMVETFTLPDGSTLDVTFTGITDADATYPRFWTKESFGGNKIDDFYDGADPMVIQVQSPGVYTFTLDFTRSGGLSGVPLHLVVADGEDNRAGEYYSATTNGDDWQFLEIMDYSAEAAIKGHHTQEVQWRDGDKTIQQMGNFPGSFFPGGVFLSQNATQLQVELYSPGGFSSVAFGVWMPYDFGDAAGYGTAAHLDMNVPTGGYHPTPGATDTLTFAEFLGTSSLAARSGGHALYLGSGLNADRTGNSDAGATQDAGDDGATFTPYDGSGTFTASVSAVNTTGGNAYLVGYLDLNGDGDFTDPHEQSSTVVLPSSGTYPVSFTGLPTNIINERMIRFRLSSNQAQAESPTGFAIDGEVEDYFSSDIVFPVELVAFEAEPRTQHIALRWRTASEVNASHFVLQRSQDGHTWTDVQVLPTQGSLEQGATYQAEDFQPHAGRNLYRLQQYDLDGSRWLSHRIQAFHQPQGLQHWQQQQQLFVQAPQSVGRLAVYDLSGRLLAEVQPNGELCRADLPQVAPSILILKAWSAQGDLLAQEKIRWSK